MLQCRPTGILVNQKGIRNGLYGHNIVVESSTPELHLTDKFIFQCRHWQRVPTRSHHKMDAWYACNATRLKLDNAKNLTGICPIRPIRIFKFDHAPIHPLLIQVAACRPERLPTAVKIELTHSISLSLQSTSAAFLDSELGKCCSKPTRHINVFDSVCTDHLLCDYTPSIVKFNKVFTIGNFGVDDNFRRFLLRLSVYRRLRFWTELGPYLQAGKTTNHTLLASESEKTVKPTEGKPASTPPATVKCAKMRAPGLGIGCVGCIGVVTARLPL